MLLLAIAFTLFAPVSSVRAHGLSDVEGRFEVGPAGARPGDTVQLRVSLSEVEPGALSGSVQVFVRIIAKGVDTQIELQRHDDHVYTGTFVAREGRHDVRVYVVRDGRRDFAVMGFIVSPSLLPLSEDESNLWFVPAGLFDAIPWLDNLSGILVALLGLAALSRLLRKTSTGSTVAKAPWGTLAAAVLGAAMMPFGAYWDISFHSEAGRETFFSAPHLMIYGGILLALVALLASLGRKPAEMRWRDHLQANRVRQVAMIGMLVVLGSAPLDELWHYLFGLDVSVWSPPHAVLIFGAVTAILALSAMEVGRHGPPIALLRALLVAAALLAGNVFLAEFEYPFPSWHISQTRPDLLYPAFLLLFALIASLVARRSIALRFGATLSVGIYLLLRVTLYPFLAMVGRDVAPALSLWIALPLLVGLGVDLFANRRAPSPPPTAMTAPIP